MCQPSSCKRWVLASALVCALAGLVLRATRPVHHHAPPPRVVKEQPRRAVKRVAADVASPSEPRDRGDGVPEPSLAGDGSWPGGQPPRATVARGEMWFSGEPPRAVFALSPTPRPAAARVPAVDPAAPREPTAERPALLPSVGRRLRSKRRKPPRRGLAAEEPNAGSSTGARVPGDTPTVPPAVPRAVPPAVPPVVPPPAQQATATNTDAAAPNDVAFHSGDDVQFPTAEQVAIPTDGKLPQAEGSVSLLVQPGWERGNEDDATLVQLGDKLRLAKNANFLRLESAGADGPAGVDVPITEWTPGEWHHVTATWSGNVLSLYVDGELVGRRTGRGPVDLPPDTALLVGSDPSENRPVAPGLIGRVDLRNRPLGDDEVARDYRDAVGNDGQPGQGKRPDQPPGRAAGPADGGGPDRGAAHRTADMSSAGTDTGTGNGAAVGGRQRHAP